MNGVDLSPLLERKPETTEVRATCACGAIASCVVLVADVMKGGQGVFQCPECGLSCGIRFGVAVEMFPLVSGKAPLPPNCPNDLP